ncbi:MAG: fibronectin type III domain-containing protein [Patescibacteria group bacterium]
MFGALILAAGFFAASSARAGTNLVDVLFEYPKLFDEANFLPSQSVSRWVKVKNVSAESQTIIAKIKDLEDTGNLGTQINLKIKKGGAVLQSGTLTGFYLDGEKILSAISPGEEVEYVYEATFNPASGNGDKGKTLTFNIDVGSQSTESVGGEGGGGGSGGGGGGYTFSDLIIYNEAVRVISGTEAEITWLTNKNATSRVIYDSASHPDITGEVPPNYGYDFSNSEDSTMITGHSMTLTGLTPATIYYFRPISHASPEKLGTELAFTTLAAGSQPLTIEPPAVEAPEGQVLGEKVVNGKAAAKPRPLSAVLGEKLAATGFEPAELVVLLMAFASCLLGIFIIKNKKLAKK